MRLTPPSKPPSNNTMKFKPKTEKELAEENMIAPGDYGFEVLNAVSKPSRAGNDMIELTLRVFVGESSRQLNDWLLESVAYKLFHFCAYTGLQKEYSAGTLTAEDCLGKTGFLTVGIQKGKKKDDGSGDVWPDRNSVKDYIRTPMKKADVVVNPEGQKPADHIEGDPY